MAVAFNQIPLQIFTPGQFIEFDPSNAVQGLQVQPHYALIVGNKLSGGTGAVNTPMLVRSYDDAVVLAGQHSQAAQMVKAFKDYDALTPLYMILLADDGGAAKSVGTWTVTGTATEDGELPFYYAGRRFTVAVESGDANTAVVTAAVTAAGELTNMPAVVTDGGAGALTATAQHAGAFTNQPKLGVALMAGERVPAGLSVALVQPASGSGDSDHDDAVTAMGDDQYHTIALGVYTPAEIAKIVTELETREGPMIQKEGVAFGAVYDSYADIITYLGNFNSSSLVIQCAEESGLLPTPWELAAQAAAMSCARTQIDPARPLTNEAFKGFYSAERGNRFTRAERDTVIETSGSTVMADSTGKLLSERMVTTRNENSQSITDYALFDLHPTVRTLHAIRYTIRARISSKFHQFKLADDGSAPRPKVVTPSVIRAELISLFLEWEDAGWVENIDQYKEDLLVERSSTDVNRVDAIIPPDIINAFLVFAGQIQFRR